MGTTYEVLPAPAIAPVHYNNLVHNPRYAIDGEIMAFVVIFLFSGFLVFIVLAPHLNKLRKRSRDSSRGEQNLGNL
ncbi:hypothetical protein R6Q59_025922 [Mikania micrantha]